MSLKIKRIRHRILVLFTLLIIFLTYVGCGAKGYGRDSDTVIMNSDELSSLEMLYGQDKITTLEALQLTQYEGPDEIYPGSWNVQEVVSFQKKDFLQFLLYDYSSEIFYGIVYMYISYNETELAELVNDLMDECNNSYGEPSTYPGLRNRLISESFSEDFLKAMSDGKIRDWHDEWSVGEKTLCTLSVSVLDKSTATVSLKYELDVYR